MATIRRRNGKKGDRWQAGVRHDGHVQWATFRTKSDAVSWARALEAAIDQGRHVDTPKARQKTLKDLLERYLAEVVPTKGDQRNPTRYAKYWIKRLGHVKLHRLQRDTIARALAELGETKAPATVNRYLATLRYACNVAEAQWGWIQANPVGKQFALREPRGRVRYLSEAERQRLLEACRESSHPELYAIVLVAITAGARRGEILGLRWRDVDLVARRAVLVDTKNGERRALTLVPQVTSALEGLQVGRRDGDLVFGDPLSQSASQFNAAWREAKEKADIEDFRFHDLRHTAASYLAMNGATLSEIATILGHKTLQMVKRYAHLSEAHVRDVVERTADKVLGNDE